MNIPAAIEQLLRAGPRTSADICARLEVSGSTVSRAIAQMPTVIQMGRARATRYGLSDGLMGLPPQMHSVFRVSAEGEAKEIGRISAIVGADFWYENLEAPDRSRQFDSLPWFLQDMRPQGFLGRATVRDFAARGWPPGLDRWTERHVLAALVQSSAHDHIGNLLIGDRSAEAFRRVRRDPLTRASPADAEARLQRYRQVVAQMGDDAMGGSSINGEQPKFTANVETPGSTRSRAVIVKFTAPLSTDAGRRWSDLLVMEELSLRTISTELGIESVRATWMTCGDRAYLEIDRFDRLPGGGRMGVISLTSLDAEYAGLGAGWHSVATRLVEAGQLSEEAPATLALLELFGDLIGNTDRHLGNTSVRFEGQRPMALTPVYDFLPMRYAPTPLDTYSEPLTFHRASIEQYDVPVELRDRAFEAAARFWQTCADDARISTAMRETSAQNARALGRHAADMRPHFTTD